MGVLYWPEIYGCPEIILRYNVAMDSYAVIGNPIAHSLSPRIHGLFAEQTGEELAYRAILSHPGEFTTDVEAFRRAGGLGLNVTLPFKEQAWEYVTHSSARADRARAANLVRFDADGRVYGDSTDGAGLVRDSRRQRCPDHRKTHIAGGRGRGGQERDREPP